MGINASGRDVTVRPVGSCPTRTIKMAKGKGHQKRELAAVYCDLPLGHPPPCKNGDWTLPKALLVPTPKPTRRTK